MTEFVRTNAKSLVLLALIAVALSAEAVGVDVGLEPEHYVALLLADAAVWRVPNRGT